MVACLSHRIDLAGLVNLVAVEVLNGEILFLIGAKFKIMYPFLAIDIFEFREKLLKMTAIIKRPLQDSEVSSKSTETMLSFCPQVKMKMGQKIFCLRWRKVVVAI